MFNELELPQSIYELEFPGNEYALFALLSLSVVNDGENAHIDPPVALQTDHPKLLFF